VLGKCVYKENLIYNILIPILQTERDITNRGKKKKSMSKMGEDRDRVQTDLAGDGIRRRRWNPPLETENTTKRLPKIEKPPEKKFVHW